MRGQISATHNYGTFICNLGSVLLGYVKDPCLSLFRPVASFKPALAELLLPAAIADIAAHDERGRMHRVITARLTKHVFTPADTAHGMILEVTWLPACLLLASHSQA